MSQIAPPPTSIQRIRGMVTSRFLRFQKWTWKLETEGKDIFDRLVENQDQFILCFWHGKYVPMLPIMRGVGGCIFTSATRRGNIIAQIIRDFGFDCIQVPDGGGQRSLQLMEESLAQSRMAGIAVDGPLGPYHVIKQGVIRLASKLDFLLLPASVDARNKHVMKKRWDLLEIPSLFTRVCLVIGEPIPAPATLEQSEIIACSSQLKDVLESLDARAAALVRGE